MSLASSVGWSERFRRCKVRWKRVLAPGNQKIDSWVSLVICNVHAHTRALIEAW